MEILKESARALIESSLRRNPDQVLETFEAAGTFTFESRRFTLDEASGGSREHQEHWEMKAERGAPRLLDIYLFVTLQVIWSNIWGYWKKENALRGNMTLLNLKTKNVFMITINLECFLLLSFFPFRSF